MNNLASTGLVRKIQNIAVRGLAELMQWSKQKAGCFNQSSCFCLWDFYKQRNSTLIRRTEQSNVKWWKLKIKNKTIFELERKKNATVKEYQTIHDILDQGLSWKNLPHCWHDRLVCNTGESNRNASRQEWRAKKGRITAQFWLHSVLDIFNASLL